MNLQTTFLLTAMLLTAFTMRAQTADTNSIPVPDGYEVLDDVSGDLDKDGIPERVIVYNTDRERYDGTVREVRIFKKRPDSWELWYTAEGPVLSSHGMGMGEPFKGVDIEKGVLIVHQYCCLRQTWSFTHWYRYQNGRFEVIGSNIVYESYCGEITKTEYNLSTGVVAYSRGWIVCDDGEAEGESFSKKYTCKLAKLPEMNGFHPDENAMNIPGCPYALSY